MTEQHPITPPPELVRHWARFQGDVDPQALWFRIATEAAQWGANQELEACEVVIENYVNTETAELLRNVRRPKPPSLKRQALAELMKLEIDEPGYEGTYDTIRRALEALPEDECGTPSDD